MPGAVDVLRELSAHAEIFIATTVMDYPNSLIDRYHWLRENFPFLSDRSLRLLWKQSHCGDRLSDRRQCA